MAFGAALAPVLGAVGIGAETSAALSPILVGAGEGALLGGLTGQGAGMGALFGAAGGLASDITGGFGGLGGGLFGGTAPSGGPAIGVGGAGGTSGLGTPVQATEAGAGAVPSYGGLGPAGSLGGDYPLGTAGGGVAAPASTGAGDVGGGGAGTSGGNLPPVGTTYTSGAFPGFGGTAASALGGGPPSLGAGSESLGGAGIAGAQGTPGGVAPTVADPSYTPATATTAQAGVPENWLMNIESTSPLDQAAGGNQPFGAGAGSTSGTLSPPSGGAAGSPGQFLIPGTNTPITGGQATGPFTLDVSGGDEQGPLGSIGNMLGKNPMSLLTGGLGLMQMMGAKKQMAQELAPLQQAATGAGGMATALAAPSMSGVLPAGQAQALETERRTQKAAVRSEAAKAGMSGSTMERDAMENVDARIAAQQVGIEQNLLQQALGYAGIQGQETEALIRDQMIQDQAYSQALSRFVSGLAGSLGSGGGASAAA